MPTTLDIRELPNFLRYPGSKRRFLTFLSGHIPLKEQVYGRFFDPFVGGGAVFFYCKPERAIIADSNSELIDLYTAIQSDHHAVWEAYISLPEGKEGYNRVRAWKPKDLEYTLAAARILYLNRTCFKGMWRHNNAGQFNVGYGGPDRRWVITERDLRYVSELLQNVTIICRDFEPVINNCEAGDFVFVDPPYKPWMKEQSNAHYVGQKFTFADQARLASALLNARKRGVSWTMTNSSHPDILALYLNCDIISLPRGTGRMPGICSANAGEVIIKY